MKNQLFATCVILMVLLTSCASYKENIYFQGLERNPEMSYKITNFSPPTIQPGDVLALTVKSLNADGSAIFNSSPATISSAKGKDSDGPAAPATGYLVNKDGEIQLPLVHSVKVGQLSLEDAAATIKSKITPFLKEPEVSVSFMNFKVSVLGDVAHPDVLSVTDERFSITDALSRAGDLTPTANRKNILLVREVDGKRKYINIDITSPRLFESPYYYLKSNDLIYVEPGKDKFASQSSTFKILPIIISIASLILVTYQVTK
ncbi:polysaccharide biosynthesis/export family protein [Mucilaginibacter sp. Mucisp86]|uniref:polysaccharide biosynthesis/export family protein n=1 Tax=Mucilaginibacter sp. Mucisp86 TaxID=3243060 RepID=UPI0039B3C0C7